MESVKTTIPVDSSWLPGSYLRIYASDAGGSVDFNTPVSGKIPVWPRHISMPIYGVTARGMGQRGSFGGLAGRGHGIRGMHTRGGSEDVVSWQGGQFYGPAGGSKTFKLGAKVFDSAGRVNASDPTSAQQVTLTINAAPRPSSGLAPTNLASHVATFTFTASEDL